MSVISRVRSRQMLGILTILQLPRTLRKRSHPILTHILIWMRGMYGSYEIMLVKFILTFQVRNIPDLVCQALHAV